MIQQRPMTKSEEDLRLRVMQIKNWTAPGPDMIHAYWLKKLTSIQKSLSTEGNHPSWLTQGRTVLVMKDPQQGPISRNYRPITCLSTTRNLLSNLLANKIGNSMDEYMHQAQRSTGDGISKSKHQLLIDHLVAKDARDRCTYLAMVWIDYKRPYDLAPYLRIMKRLRLYKIDSSLVIRQSMSHWKTILSAKFNEGHRCHHQLRCISRRRSVTSAVLYRAQPIERPAGQEYLWIQVQRWYHN